MVFLDDESRKVLERVVVAISFMVTVGFGILLFMPTGMHVKTTQIWAFEFGLTNVHINTKTLGGTLLKGLYSGSRAAFAGKGKKKTAGSRYWKELGKAWGEGDHSIETVRNQLCNIELLGAGYLNNCWIWSQVLYGSWALMVGMVLAMVLLLGGCALLLVKRNRCIRSFALGCFGLAAFASCCGAGAYVVLTFNLSRWLIEIYGSHDGLTFSQGSVAAAALTLLTVLNPGLLWCARTFTGDESEYYGDDDFGPPLQVDQYGNPSPAKDQYGNPIPVDQFGNPMVVDQYGNPVQRDQYGNPDPVQAQYYERQYQG